MACVECTPIMAQVEAVGKLMPQARPFTAADIPQTAVETFWRLLDRTGDCWEWQGDINAKNGYGRLYLGRVGHRRYQSSQAHRVAYVLQIGPIPAGMLVCHHCDNRRCGRGDHLFLGTAKANALDRDAKGRHTGGPGPARDRDAWRAAISAALKGRPGTPGSTANAKLCREDVVAIRRACRAGATYVELAARYNLDPSTIRLAAVGTTWKSVTEEVAS